MKGSIYFGTAFSILNPYLCFMQIQQSYWEQQSFFKDIQIIIIGSGIVGLSAAIRCKEQQPHAKVIILEKGTLPIGASTRNAGFACFGSITELLDDLENQTESEVLTLVERRWKGLKKLRSRVGDQQLGYKAWGGMEIFRKEESDTAQNCIEKIDYFNQLIAPITGLKETYQVQNDRISEMGFSDIDTMINNVAEGQIHTGNMMKALLNIARSKGVDIYNGIGVSAIEDNGKQVQLITDAGWTIQAEKVLVATNGFARQLLPDLKVTPARNQVLITEPIENLPVKGCFHYDKGYVYFRNIDNRILLGGFRNLAREAETTDAFGLTTLIQDALEDLLKTVILPKSDVKIATRWSGILGIADTKQPIIQSISKNVVVAVRMGGMGVAIGSLVGEEGADVVLGVITRK